MTEFIITWTGRRADGKGRTMFLDIETYPSLKKINLTMTGAEYNAHRFADRAEVDRYLAAAKHLFGLTPELWGIREIEPEPDTLRPMLEPPVPAAVDEVAL